MSFKTAFLRAIPMAALGFITLFAPLAQAQTGAKHVVIQPAQPSDSADKTEVLEFFAYSCPHCATMEPLVSAWAEKLPDDVVIRQVPVAFNASMVDLQKLYYTLESMSRLDLHPKVFEAIHQQKKRIFDAKAITDWVATHDVDRAKFESTYNSFGVNSKISRANELAKNYGIEGTPSLAIGGRYVVSPSMAGSYQGTIDEAQKLLDDIRQ